ncbi:homoprotocatechuate degradation operon regulator HpaR [Azospirillum sp.]|uniref:homoprotocatechuate degradation operon regulator HpaR n=1 Tax=Azospirillum sp. TaxID=34012 RepID=UPI002D36A89F|nr:homoprotocatechuate degradation operon regulator HpaR [Azospirillum sp.]HYD68763.1 homoprotocatechuate degradation operon regulator HpaR [Azospirillum sp.]
MDTALRRTKTATTAPLAEPTPGEDLRAFSRSLPMALLKAREAVMARFRPLLREHDLTEQQWRVLRALTTVDGLRAGELARVSCISMPSLSRILKVLEKRGLTVRTAEESDLRAVQIAISATGRALVAGIGPHSERRYAEITQAFGTQRLDALYAELEALTACLAGDGDPPPDDEE